MGDRANIQIKSSSDDPGVYLYTHWGGTQLPQTLQAALRRGIDRWHDDAYLARIIFCEMVKDDVLGLLGYGISNYVPDGENRILVVNVAAQSVSFSLKCWSFVKFAELSDDELKRVWR